MPQLARMLNSCPWIGSIFSEKSSSAPAENQPNAPKILKRSQPTLSGVGLSRSFGHGETQTYALQDVSVALHQGELNLLMGPSGSGKSTLLAVLSALLRPNTGQVQALDHDVWNLDEMGLEQFRLRHCSYIFQGYNLFPALTAREQLEIVLRWGEGVSSREARHRSEKVLSQLGLGKKLHLRPAEMSGGEKQRVAIGRALVKNPSFLFADEPTSALDWENGQQVIELLNNVARNQGATVLVVTHDPRLLPFADRIYEMADGQLCPEGSGHNSQQTPTQRSQEIVDLTCVTPMPPSNRFHAHSEGRAAWATPHSTRLHLQEPSFRHAPDGR